MSTFQLDILTPTRVFYSGDCQSLVVPITDGMLGIRAGRAPITASITFGEAYYLAPSGEKVVFSVSGGMLDVRGGSVKLLCDTALRPEEIDEEAERLEAETARLELETAQSHTDYLLSRLMLSNAVNNLKVKHKNSVN